MTTELLARRLYEAYWFKWYGGHQQSAKITAPSWENSPSKDVWRARAAALLAEGDE